MSEIDPVNKVEAVKFATLFRNNLVQLLLHADILIQYINSHEDVLAGKVQGTGLDRSLLRIAIAAAEAVEPEKSVTVFIRRSKEHWDKILTKNLTFLTSNAEVLFSEAAPANQIKEFSKCFTIVDSKQKVILTQNKIDNLWLMFRAMIENCMKFIHYSRNPHLIGSSSKGYRNPDFFSDIQLSTYNNLLK